MGQKQRIRPTEKGPIREASPLRRLWSSCFRAVYSTRQVTFDYGISLITRLLPERLWYPAIWRISRVQAFLVGPIIARSILRNDPRRLAMVAWMVEAWLRWLNTQQPKYVPPITVRGLEACLRASGNEHGLVFCSVHLPLVFATLAPVKGMPFAPTWVVATDVRPGGTFPVWGYEDGLPAIKRDGLALVRMRSILRRGGSVAVLIDLDDHWCKSLSVNTLHLVRALGARLIFMLPEIRKNGQVIVEYVEPPDPWCRSDESIALNMKDLRERIDRILSGNPTTGLPPVAPVEPVVTAKKTDQAL